ncbi:hypothetical protein D3C76_1305130 [compost metagenome]
MASAAMFASSTAVSLPDVFGAEGSGTTLANGRLRTGAGAGLRNGCGTGKGAGTNEGKGSGSGVPCRLKAKDCAIPIERIPKRPSRLPSAGPINSTPSTWVRRLSTSKTCFWVGWSK